MSKIYKSKIIFTLLSFTFSAFNPIIAQQGTWDQKTNFGGSARAKALSFSIGTKGYVGTGNNASDLMDFWEYNPQNDTWTQKANLGNIGRNSGIGFSIGNKGYAGLGISNSQPLSDFWEYNPQNNTWMQKAYYPGTGKISAVGFSIGNFGYVGTGGSLSPIGNETKQFWQYDPIIDTWIQKADFGGNQRDRAVGFSISSKGYIGTGYQYDGVNPSQLGDFWEYNPATDSWIQKANVPALPRTNAVGFSTSTRGYIGMGHPARTDFWQYSPETNSWLQVAQFGGAGRMFATGFSIGNKGYVGMGYSVSAQGTTFYRDLWQYNEQTLGLNQQFLQDTLKVYPNPTSDFINLLSNEDITEIIIYNTEGKEQLRTSVAPINISSFPAGVYYLKITTFKGVSTEKIIKN